MAMNYKKMITVLTGSIILVFSAITLIAQDKAVFSAYKGVTIGMSADDARAKLGKATDTSDTEDNYDFSDNESARVFFDEAKKVRAISITYSGGDAIPKPEAVIGTKIDARPDGGMYKMVEFPKQHFWISYVRTGGDSPLVIITIQKMAVEADT